MGKSPPARQPFFLISDSYPGYVCGDIQASLVEETAAFNAVWWWQREQKEKSPLLVISRLHAGMQCSCKYIAEPVYRTPCTSGSWLPLTLGLWFRITVLELFQEN